MLKGQTCKQWTAKCNYSSKSRCTRTHTHTHLYSRRCRSSLNPASGRRKQLIRRSWETRLWSPAGRTARTSAWSLSRSKRERDAAPVNSGRVDVQLGTKCKLSMCVFSGIFQSVHPLSRWELNMMTDSVVVQHYLSNVSCIFIIEANQ